MHGIKEKYEYWFSIQWMIIKHDLSINYNKGVSDIEVGNCLFPVVFCLTPAGYLIAFLCGITFLFHNFRKTSRLTGHIGIPHVQQYFVGHTARSHLFVLSARGLYGIQRSTTRAQQGFPTGNRYAKHTMSSHSFLPHIL